MPSQGLVAKRRVCDTHDGAEVRTWRTSQPLSDPCNTAPVVERGLSKREALMTASSDRSAYFYENTKWRLLFSLTWIVLLLVALVALLGFGGATHDQFSAVGNLRFLTDQFLVIALLVPAMVMIVGAGGLDLSVGAVMGLAGVVFCAAAGRGTPVPSAAIMGLGAARWWAW